MKFVFLSNKLGLLSLIVFFTMCLTSVDAQSILKDKIGAFSLMCEKPTGFDKEVCALVQQVESTEKQNARLTMTIGKFADDNSYFMRINAPLGVFLPGLLLISVDGKELGRMPFIRCWPNGCMSETAMAGNLLTAFKNGSKATFKVFLTPEVSVNLDLSLEGVTAGIERLSNL